VIVHPIFDTVDEEGLTTLPRFATRKVEDRDSTGYESLEEFDPC